MTEIVKLEEQFTILREGELWKTPVRVLKQGDSFPDIHVESREGDVALADRWRNGPLVVAFMRHFG